MRDRKELMDSPTYKGPNPRSLFPVRSEVEWFYRDGRVVLEYPKNFNRLERQLHKVLKGPKNIRRPLDEVGTLLWEMSDGEHSLVEIYLEQQKRFHERVEPVDKVVGGLLETMLELGLMRLHQWDGSDRTQVRKARRVVIRERDG
ncbi:MAG: PqqD family peptide modification chaperone [Candidatus Thermoplasmatota archaeon]|nr:PqqD family peptide modification chaperone [Candidatus Thermoplasmatota archaeon]